MTGRRIALLFQEKQKQVDAICRVWEGDDVAVLVNPNDPHLEHQLDQIVLHERWDEAGERKVGEPGRCYGAGTILLTSGSTGEPKAVYHTLAAHQASARAVAEFLSLEEHHSWDLNLPLWHVSGLSILVRCLVTGARLRFDGKATHRSLVSTQLVRLLQAETTPAHKALLLGGGPMPKQLFDEGVQRGLPLHLSYGMTEMAATIAIAKKGEWGKVGLPLPGRQLELRNGEIWVKGDSLFSGYWTGQGLHQPFDEQGWFQTGDLGEWSEGELRVIGRKDSRFFSGGENISPEEIEKALLSLPGIQQAIVVPREDPEFGHLPVAFIAPGPRDSLREELQEHLPNYKIPREYRPIPQKTPRSSTGKISRKELQVVANNTFKKESVL